MQAREFLEIGRHAIQITGFVMVMMLVVEYVNVRTQGNWQHILAKRSWQQYVLAASLGATPGCLGAFAVVTLYAHRNMSLGALIAAMIATAGDESFVMFATIPRQAFVLHLMLFCFGIAVGMISDVVLGRLRTSEQFACPGLVVHGEHVDAIRLSRVEILRQWRHCSLGRGALSTALALIFAGTITGQIGPDNWNWVRTTILAGTLLAAFIVATVSDHFLEEHLWNHIALQHIPRVFLWTLGALIAVHTLIEYLDLEHVIQNETWLVFIVASLVGLIPESGPHLVFVTMYAKGTIPFGVLLANSVVQDGHGMLPLLAHSRKAFFFVKAVNLVTALIVGSIVLALRI